MCNIKFGLNWFGSQDIMVEFYGTRRQNSVLTSCVNIRHLISISSFIMFNRETRQTPTWGNPSFKNPPSSGNVTQLYVPTFYLFLHLTNLHRLLTPDNLGRFIIIIITITIIIIFLHGLGRSNCFDIDALPSFPGASTVSSSSRSVVDGVFRQSGFVHSFKVVDPGLFVFESHVVYSRDLQFFPYEFASYFIQPCVSRNTS